MRCVFANVDGGGVLLILVSKRKQQTKERRVNNRMPIILIMSVDPRASV